MSCENWGFHQVWRQEEVQEGGGDSERMHATVSGWVDQENVIYTEEYYSGHSNLDNMGEPRGHYTKWNTLDEERQVLYSINYLD